ncbi:MAG: CDP-alcohol phosphatidyltransferase family protein [Actinobacteria bacterium]|nr:CDP-alcohol phosphatidyltransferase family protein [Actinomycetota bacterium]
MRALLQPVWEPAATRLARLGVTADVLTALGLVLGLAAAGAAAARWWGWALALWLVSRTADGLDGAVARVARSASDRGGFLDIVADFTVYGAFVVGCAVGRPDARLALLVLLLTYYVNGTAFLAFSSVVERRRHDTALADERSFVFARGLAEGTETILAHALLVAFPAAMAVIAWAFAGVVAITVVQRVRLAVRVLADGDGAGHRGTSR